MKSVTKKILKNVVFEFPMSAVQKQNMRALFSRVSQNLAKIKYNSEKTKENTVVLWILNKSIDFEFIEYERI